MTTDPVAAYLVVEHDLLTWRLRCLLAGDLRPADDPGEERYETEFERLWNLMTTEDRDRLHRERLHRSLPSESLQREPDGSPAASGTAGHPSDWSPTGDPGYVIRTRALPEGIELSIPPATPTSLRRPGAHITRMVLDAAGLEAFGTGAKGVLVDSALALLGRSLDDVRAQGGLRFVDPETGEELLAIAGVPTGVAETRDPPRP